MKDELEKNGIATEFVETTDDTVFIGYETSENDASNLFTELRLVVQIVLDHTSDEEVKGAIFHTHRPIIGLWRVETDWVEQHRDDELSEMALVANVLHSLNDVSFV